MPVPKKVTFEQVKELLDAGYLVIEIAEKLGVSRGTVGQRLRENGINLRNHKGATKRHSEFMRENNPIPKGSTRPIEEMQGSIKARKRIFAEKKQQITTFKEYARIARYIAYAHYGKGKDIPEGLVIDHIFSIKQGWDNEISVDDISHPNNLRLIPREWNILKGPDSYWSLEDFKVAIKN